MSTAPKKRTKSVVKTQRNNPSPSSSLLIEPPKNLFPSKGEFLRLVAVLAIASSVAFTCNFIASYLNPAEKPFCDSNIESSDTIADFCEPCPSNGQCNQGVLKCVHGYQKRGNICVEDGDINEGAKKLVCSEYLIHDELMKHRVCEAYAKFLCEGTGTIWVHENDIWNNLEGHELMRDYRSDNLLYAYAKRRAVEIIDALLETRTNSLGNRELKCPDLLAESYKPFTCRIHQWISNHALVIAPVFVLVLGFSFLIRKVRRRWYLSTRSEELYRQVCDILEEHALMSKRVNAECEPWVVASRLRDHALLPKERRDPVLWRKVEQLVQEDSRVDQYPKMVKGEPKVVWEWQVEGSLSSERVRRKMESKSKFTEGIPANSEPQRHSLKSEPKIPMF